MEHVPNKRLTVPRVFAFDGDPKPFSPTCHRALRTGRCQGIDDRLDDFLTAMRCAQGDWRTRLGPNNRPFAHLDGKRSNRAGVLRDTGIEQIGICHHNGGLRIGEG